MKFHLALIPSKTSSNGVAHTNYDLENIEAGASDELDYTVIITDTAATPVSDTPSNDLSLFNYTKSRPDLDASFPGSTLGKCFFLYIIFKFI